MSSIFDSVPMKYDMIFIVSSRVSNLRKESLSSENQPMITQFLLSPIRYIVFPPSASFLVAT